MSIIFWERIFYFCPVRCEKNIVFFLLSFVFFGNTEMFAQNIGINTTGATADPSALLDISGVGLPANDQKGVLFPRVELVQTTVANPVVAPATGLMLYNTATVNDVSPGYYYWDGSVWKRLIDIPVAEAWQITGNAGTDMATNFLGTTDNVGLVIRTNNTERLRVTAAGRVGINNTAPNNLTMLDVNGYAIANNFFFYARTNAQQANYGDNAVVSFDEIYDPHNNYNPANGRYTAPVTGYYFFTTTITFEGNDGNDTQYINFQRDGVNFTRSQINPGHHVSSDRELTQSFSAIIYLTAGQYVRVTIDNVAGSNEIDMHYKHFTGFLISK
jgi:hypothetical protein